MEFEETPPKQYGAKQALKTLPKPTEKRKTMKTKSQAPVAKQPRAIKLSTIWKVLVYTFAVIGVILSVLYVNDIVNGIVDSRAEAKVQEMLKAQKPTGESAPASKVTQ